jgi:hypothetical protein
VMLINTERTGNSLDMTWAFEEISLTFP